MMLIHRCLSCSHPEEWHAANDCSYGACRCGTNARDINPVPELVKRFVLGTTDVVTDVCPPGVPPFGEHYNPAQTKTCACDACQAAYVEATRGVPA